MKTATGLILLSAVAVGAYFLLKGERDYGVFYGRFVKECFCKESTNSYKDILNELGIDKY